MNFDWTKPMIIDWSGRNGPLISEEDIKNSVLKRILRNQYCPPLCEREIVRVKPWWNPQQPFGINVVNNPECRVTRFVPGLHNVPPYPQLSTLTKQQHQCGLRVLAAEHDVQPRNYPHPTRKDYNMFAEIKELYEKEQKEFIKWAKQCWINGDCIRALRPKPTIEKVYDAEFKMRASEVHSLPQSYALAAQIPLETTGTAYEFEHKQDLLSVDVQDLPVIDYPEEMDKDFSILQPCLVPEPCSEHPCKFVLPNEDSVSVLPLTEIHRELAQYAIENGASFVASENALHCLIQTERSWKLPISVVEVVCPEYGDVKNVVVLGSEFGVRKDCATQRTYKAYKHLLHQGFVPSKCNYKIKSTKRTSEPNTPKGDIKLNAQPLDSFLSLDDDLDVSSDSEERLEIDDHEIKSKPDKTANKPCEPESNSDPDDIMIDVSETNPEPYYEDARHSYSDNEPSSEPDRLTMDAADEINDQDSRPSYSLNDPDSEPDMVTIDDICENKNKESRPDYSINEPSSNPDWLTIDDLAETINQDFRPSYSLDDPDSEPDMVTIDDICENKNKETRPDYSINEPSSNPDWLTIDDLAEAINQDSRPSYSLNEPNSEPDMVRIEDIRENKNIEPRPSYSLNEPNSEPDMVTIDDICENKNKECRPGFSINEPSSNPDWLTIDAKNINKDFRPSCSLKELDKLAIEDVCKSNSDFCNHESRNKSNFDSTAKAKPSYSTNESSSETDELMIDDVGKTNPEPCNHESDKTNYSNTHKTQSSYSKNESSSESDELMIDDVVETNPEPCNYESNKPNYSHSHKARPRLSKNESSSEPDELMIDNVDETNSEPSNHESDKPNYSHSHKAKPSCSKNESSSEPDELMIDDVDETNPEPCYIQDSFEPNYSIIASDPKNTETWFNLDSYEPDYNYDNIERPSYSKSENSSKSDKLTNSNKKCDTTFKAGYYQDYNKPINTEDIPSYGQNEAKRLVDEAKKSPTIKISMTKPMNQNSPEVSTQITREATPVKSCSLAIRNSISEPEPTSKTISTDSFKSGKQSVTSSSEGEVFELATIKKTNKLSPVKPCSVSVELLNIEAIKKVNIGVNKSMRKPSEVTKTVSSLRKQGSGETSNDISCNNEINTNIETDIVSKTISESKNNNPDNFERTKIVTKQVSPIKPCIKKPNNERSPKSTNQEINIDCHPVNDTNTERQRRLSDQIYQEHDYCKDILFSSGSNNSSPGKQNDNTVESHNNTSRKPGVRKLSFNETIVKSTKIGTSNNNQLNKSVSKNLESKNNRTVKTNAGKMSIKDLFGDESDSDEPICRLACYKPASNNIEDSSLKILEPRQNEVSKDNLNSNKATEHNTRKLSFSDPISLMTDNIERSPLKPCLRSPGFNDSSPRNSKRKLSFSDPLTSDPEFMSFSEPDSDVPIVGFDNGVAVLSQQPKCSKKQKDTSKCSYSLRSRIEPAKPAKTTKSKTTKEPLKETSGFTKIVPQNKHKRTIALRNRRVSAQTNSDTDSDYSQDSENIPINEYINILKTTNVSLKRSLRSTSRLNTENSKVSPSNENTNVSIKNTLQIKGAKILRRSSRLSVRSTKGNIQPKTNQATKFNEKTMNTNSFSKITKKGRNRRMSLPANIFSNTDKINQVFHSKSMTNLNEIANKKTLQKVPLSKSLSNSTSSLNTKDATTLSTLELTERTIRYFHRSYNSIYSETDRSEGEMSKRTKRYIRRSLSSACSEVEKSDGEVKRRTKKYTRRISSTAPYTKTTNNPTGPSDSMNQEKELSERTKRYMNRSISFAYSSCDETDEPMPIRRKKTKREPEASNAKVDATNKMPTSVMKTNKINQSNSTQLKTKAIDITENNESIESETIQDGESNKMDACDANNEDKIEVLNILNFKATTEMDLSESSDDEMLQCNNSSHVDNASLTKANETNKRRSISESSDNSDNYFDSNETEELNLFHFTATNATDSEEESEIENNTVGNSSTESINDNTEDLITVIEIADEDDDVSMREEIPIQLENIKTCDISKTEITRTEDKKNKTNSRIETEVEQDKNKNSHISNKCSENQNKTPVKKSAPSKENVGDFIGIHTCTCKDTQFAVPPPRSFKRWLVRNKTSNISFNLMVHAPHKARKGNREVILEPIVEYQPELGGVRQTEGRLRALALSLMLRESALLMNVRVDHENGNVLSVEKLSRESSVSSLGTRTGEWAGVLHVALDQLRYLRPGRYVLAHDSCHGTNAMLYTTRGAAAAPSLTLREQNTNMPDAEDALFAKIPPELAPVLLPFHKHRSILPLAFTPFKNQVREDRRALARAKPPPPAIQWPKKKKKSKKNRTGRPPRTDVIEP